MEWTQTIGTLAGMLVGFFTIWWRLDSKLERKFDTLDSKIDTLNAFLRDTLLEFKSEIGELKGVARTPAPAQDRQREKISHPDTAKD